MKKRIIFSFLLDIACIACLFLSAKRLNHLLYGVIHNPWYKDAVFKLKVSLEDFAMNCCIYSLAIIISISCLVFFTIYFIKAIKRSNASNFVRYTYEEYKEYRANKKAQKQADKKAKLQAELNKMEKAE
jgi:hypothetical protein